jgi:membrane protein
MPSSSSNRSTASVHKSQADISTRHSVPHRRWWHALAFASHARRTWVRILRITFKRFIDDNILDLAATVSFYFVLSLLPFLIVLAAFVGWLPSTNIWQSFAQWITDYFPARSRQIVFSTILDLTRGYTGIVSFGLLLAIWSASSGFMSLMEALCVACCGKDKRGYWRKRAVATVATLVASIFCILSFGLWTMGHWATRALFAEFERFGTFHLHWKVVAWWLGTVVLLSVGISLINYFLPDLKRSWRWFSPGNIFSVVGILLTTVGFNLFLRYSPTVPQVYTVLAGFVILMTWIYSVTLVILLGTELDTVVHEMRQKDLHQPK